MKYQPQFSKVLITLALAGVFSTSSASQVAQAPYAPTNSIFGFESPANFCWSGPFVGGYIGGAWGHSNVSTTVGALTDTAYFPSTPIITSIARNGSGSFTPSAFIGGVQFGGNWMYQNFLYGLVLDYGAFNLSSSNFGAGIYPDDSTYTQDTKIKTDWLYTVRGRLGWAPTQMSWPFMIYGTGGLAVTKLQVSNYFSDTTALVGVGGSRNGKIMNGWVLGAGVECAITQNWTINGEYLYARFASVKVNSSIYNSAAGFGIAPQSLVNPFNTSANLYANFFKVGLNYKFTPVA